MDPDACLKELLELAKADHLPEADRFENAIHDYLRMQELVEALDGWIVKGGFLPARWR